MDAWLSQFPTREVDEPATKDFVHAEVALVRTDIAELRTELQSEFHSGLDGLRRELREESRVGLASASGEMDGLRREVAAEFGKVRGEMDGLRREVAAEFGKVRGEMDGFRRDMHAGFDGLRADMRHQLQWTIGALLTAVGLSVTVAVVISQALA